MRPGIASGAGWWGSDLLSRIDPLLPARILFFFFTRILRAAAAGAASCLQCNKQSRQGLGESAANLLEKEKIKSREAGARKELDFKKYSSHDLDVLISFV